MYTLIRFPVHHRDAETQKTNSFPHTCLSLRIIQSPVNPAAGFHRHHRLSFSPLKTNMPFIFAHGVKKHEKSVEEQGARFFFAAECLHQSNETQRYAGICKIWWDRNINLLFSVHLNLNEANKLHVINQGIKEFHLKFYLFPGVGLISASVVRPLWSATREGNVWLITFITFTSKYNCLCFLRNRFCAA